MSVKQLRRRISYVYAVFISACKCHSGSPCFKIGETEALDSPKIKRIVGYGDSTTLFLHEVPALYRLDIEKYIRETLTSVIKPIIGTKEHFAIDLVTGMDIVEQCVLNIWPQVSEGFQRIGTRADIRLSEVEMLPAINRYRQLLNFTPTRTTKTSLRAHQTSQSQVLLRSMLAKLGDITHQPDFVQLTASTLPAETCVVESKNVAMEYENIPIEDLYRYLVLSMTTKHTDFCNILKHLVYTGNTRVVCGEDIKNYGTLFMIPMDYDNRRRSDVRVVFANYIHDLCKKMSKNRVIAIINMAQQSYDGGCYVKYRAWISQ